VDSRRGNFAIPFVILQVKAAMFGVIRLPGSTDNQRTMAGASAHQYRALRNIRLQLPMRRLTMVEYIIDPAALLSYGHP